ncbi:hypothetical protein NPX13_g9977 [Xylaria arbuscula]|uniref:Zn(2)-C6 fungal-type domain-containing protein n=1 Tax=Xylaria arbuscula TaxID=114810 RepID=A0A9W8TIC7_9PEZI|nr:hypothetical protein NPX13_g9977 [Xylaria arbuscula]
MQPSGTHGFIPGDESGRQSHLTVQTQPTGHVDQQPPTDYAAPHFSYQPLPPNVSLHPHSALQLKKGSRAAVACDFCRKLKMRCQGGNPCKACKEKNEKCTYHQAPDTKNIEARVSVLDKKPNTLVELVTQLSAPIKVWNAIISSATTSKLSEQTAHITAFTLDHTARTNLLLNWPSIQMLTVGLLEAEGIRSIDELHLNMGQQPGISTISRLDRVGNPNFDPYTVMSYAWSFKEYILNMHPIIAPGEIDSIVDTFLGRLSQAPTTTELVIFDYAISEKPESSQQRIDEAVALLVLALGRICLCSDTTAYMAGYPPRVPPGGPPSPIKTEEAVPMARDTLYGGDLGAAPGLEYFALATKILHCEVGEHSLRHVHAQILAGLYCGQLGCILDSSAQSRLFQHEHVILDSISSYQDKMPYPNSKMMTDQGVAERVMTSYFAQLFLQKQRSDVYTLHCSPNRSMSNYSNLVDKIQAGLKASRNTWVPPPYHWNAGDPPADDLLAARLRAKYWDLQVILYRPFLQQILHRDQPQTHVGEELLTNARLAIQAVIESLRPFHGLRGGQRLIITNMLETAHSQWGNLLLLTACYKDKLLCQYVDKTLLKNLFAQTVYSLGGLDRLFPILGRERKVLVELAKGLGFVPCYIYLDSKEVATREPAETIEVRISQIREELNNEKSRSGSELDQLQQRLDQLEQELDKLAQSIADSQQKLSSFKNTHASQSS